MEQLDLTLEHMSDGRGVIYALPHMGDFEQAGRWVILAGAGSFTTVGRAAQAGVGLPDVPRVPPGPRDGSAADHRRPAPVRRDGTAAAGRKAGLHRRRQGPVGHRRRGGLLRREGAVPGRARRPRRADRRGADAGGLLVRRRGRVGRAHPRRDPRPRRGRPQAEGRRDDPGHGAGLRAGDQRAPGRLAHAAEALRQRPRPRAAGPQPRRGAQRQRQRGGNGRPSTGEHGGGPRRARRALLAVRPDGLTGDRPACG